MLKKTREAKMGNKPIHNLHPTAGHTGEYQDKLNNPDHMQLSTATERPKGNVPTPQGGNFWGDPNNMDLTQPGGPINA